MKKAVDNLWWGAAVAVLAVILWLCYYFSLLTTIVNIFLWLAIIVAVVIAAFTIIAMVRKESTGEDQGSQGNERARLGAALGVILIAVVILARMPSVDTAGDSKETETFIINTDDLEDISQDPLIAEAIDEAQRASDAGDIELAEIYILNAVQHSKYNVEILQKYRDLVVFVADQQIKNQNGINVEVIDRAAAFLGSALIRVNPSDVTMLRDWLVELETKREQLFAANLPDEPVQSLDIRWQQLSEAGNALLKKLPLNAGSEDRLGIATHIQNIQLLLEEADESLDPDSYLEVQKKVEYWKNLERILDVISYMDLCLQNLNAFPEGSDARAVILQAAEGTQPSLCGYDLLAYPENVRAKIAENIDRLQREIKEIQYDRSKSKIETIITNNKDVMDLVAQDVSPGEKYESRCKEIQKYLHKVQAAYQDIKSEKARKEVESKIKEMVEALGSQRKKQFAAYQLAVLNKLQRALNSYMNENVVNSHDAEVIFNTHTLYNVDLTKLTPETAQCYQRVTGLLFAELAKGRVIKVEKNMITQPKMKLEAF